MLTQGGLFGFVERQREGGVDSGYGAAGDKVRREDGHREGGGEARGEELKVRRTVPGDDVEAATTDSAQDGRLATEDADLVVPSSTDAKPVGKRAGDEERSDGGDEDSEEDEEEDSHREGEGQGGGKLKTEARRAEKIIGIESKHPHRRRKDGGENRGFSGPRGEAITVTGGTGNKGWMVELGVRERLPPTVMLPRMMSKGSVGR